MIISGSSTLESAFLTVPIASKNIGSQSVEAITESIIQKCEGKKILILAPIVQEKKGTYEKFFERSKNEWIFQGST